MSDYADIQARKNAQARREYADLWPTLTPEQRAVLESTDRETGKRKLDMDDSFVSHSVSAEEAPEPSERTDMAACVDTLADQVQEQFDLTPGQAEGIVEWHRAAVAQETHRQVAIRLARVLGTLLRVENLKQEVYALLYATGTAAANGLGSMRKTAQLILKPNGQPVTVASLSKRACWWIGFLDLPPVAGLKTASAVEAYTHSARRGHATRRNSKLQKALDRLNRGFTPPTLEAA